MAEEVAALVVRLEATEARFARDMQRAEAAMRRSAGGMENRAQQMSNRVSNSFARMGRSSGFALQQVGFQVGDFAVQVASGSGVLRPFIQQGTQLVSMFGPMGAIVGAVGASIGALATSLIGAGDASEEADDSLDALADTANGLESAVSDLTSIVEAYADAIRDTAVASDYASARIIANSKAEFAARQQLLRLDTFDTRQQQFQRQSEIERLRQEEADTRRGGNFGTLFDEERRRRSIPQEMMAETPALTEARRAAIDRSTEAAKQAQNISRQASRLEATSTIVQQQIEEADRLLSMTFDEVLTQVQETNGGGGGGRSGGGGGGRDAEKNTDAIRREIQAIHDRRDALEFERSLIGQSEAARVRETAARERQRTVDDLLAKAKQEDIQLTSQQIAQVQQLATDIETLTVANFAYKANLEAASEAAEEAEARQEELSRSVADVADRFSQAIQSADSFANALRNIGVELANLAVQGLAGQGPLAPLLGDLIGGVFGAAASGFSVSGAGAGSTAFFSGGIGGGSLSFSAKGNAFSHGNVIPFARGGVVSGPTIFPMANGMGLMGEAGPEAVLPLMRGAGGRLGVQASGGGDVSVTVVNNLGVEAQATQRRNGSGGLEVILDRATAQQIGRAGSMTSQALAGRGRLKGR